MRLRLIAVFVLLTPLAASAQFVEPEVEVRKLSERAHPSIAEDEPAVMSADEFYKLRNKVFSVEDVAVVRIAFKGKWYKSADYLAREKAAILGANGLVLVESLGQEDRGTGATRTYRAFRFTDAAGRPVYTTPASEPVSQTRAETAQAPATFWAHPAQTPAPPPTPPKKHRHFDWVWMHDASVLSHRLGFDASLAAKEESAQLKLYVRENFPAGQEKKLVEAYGKRSRVVLDFVKRTVE